MLSTYEWLCRSRSGADLLAGLRYFQASGTGASVPAPPRSALRPVCGVCNVFEAGVGQPTLCPTCAAIKEEKARLGYFVDIRILRCVLGHASKPPWHLRGRKTPSLAHADAIALEDGYFLLILRGYDVVPWMSELVLEHGEDYSARLQIFPTIGGGRLLMGDCLRLAYFRDQLQARRHSPPGLELICHANVFDLLPGKKKQGGLFCYGGGEFLRLANMMALFRRLLGPEEQEELNRALADMHANRHFYYGRLLARLSPEARDMLETWNVLQWSPEQFRRFRFLFAFVPLRR